jgi:hypothetical protein
VRLHPDTARQIAREQDRRNRPLFITLIVLLVVIAGALLWRFYA